MGTTGAPYNLRYPELNDAANVPTDMSELAADVAAALGGAVQSGTVSIAASSTDTAKDATVTFPKAFKSVPRVVATATGTSVLFAYVSSTPTLTTASVGIRKFDGTPINATITVQWVAVAGQ